VRSGNAKRVLAAVLIVMATILGWVVISRFQGQDSRSDRAKGMHAAPVEVAEIEQGPIELRRTYSGTLEALAKFVVAPKVSGRVERLSVDISDPVRRGEVVAELDNDEYVQAVAQARADLAVAKANRAEAESALKIADRDLERVGTLRKRGVASESQFDTAAANRLAKQVQLEVARAQVTRAKSALETANIRLGYTKITADWTSGDEHRVVAERYVDQGETVSANTPLLLIVEIDPITGVIFVTEKDYARLKPGQLVTLTTDAFPGERFEGRIDRIAPVFREATRQARVELTIDNPQRRLKPGMFIRAEIVLEQVPLATIVPEQALTKRDDRTGVFLVDDDGQTVTWRDVTVGITEGGRVQVEGEGLTGRVVTLGQQLVSSGSRITIPDAKSGTSSSAK
jgi:RND family efflux transporter MFP subunit